jgi:hypothetical protein
VAGAAGFEPTTLQYPKLIFVVSRSFLLMPDGRKSLYFKAFLVPRESSAMLKVLTRGDLELE